MRDFVYGVDKGRDRKNELMGNWLRGWCKEEYNRDWDYCVTLTYKTPLINDWLSRRYLKKYITTLRDRDKDIDGFVVNELDDNMVGLHHHLILKTDIKEFRLRSETNKVWSNKGISDIMRYDVEYEFDFCQYMCKHIGKTYRNSFDVISNYG